ncbi:MAG: mucoidy inhibitor MuiA family protein [Hyphomicrobium sp.]|uniref:mucoidy inhibitor MuiA family protein n=1 Tax=Hyphomicrobium sp. TaxID=82 RepID=UPI00356446F2
MTIRNNNEGFSAMRFALAAVLVAAQSLSAHAADVPATSVVDAVTVFLSGAEVTRLAKVKLDKGESTIILGDVPASAVPGSIRVEGKATGKIEIGSVDTAHKLLQRQESQAADVKRKEFEDRVEQLKDERTAIDAQAQAAAIQKKLIANLAELPKRRPSSETAAGAGDDWQKILSLIPQASGESGKLALEAQQKIRVIDRNIKDIKNQLASLAPAKTEQTEIRVFVYAQTPVDADLTIRYQVPDANWAPIYDARLQTGTKTEPPKLTLARRAAISQRTGEDWTGVALQLSTSRPSDGASAPMLDTQFVDYEQPPRPVAAAPASVNMEFAKRDRLADGRALGGVAAAPPPPEPEMDAAPVVETVAKLDSAPFEATFEVPGRTTVAGNGDVKRVLLMSDDIEPLLGSRSVPKLDSNAYLYATLKIAKGTPLLPGRVYLFRDGTFVGTGDVPLLPPGEEYKLGFGIDDQVKVKHAVLEEKRGESGLISTSHVDSRSFRVNVKNLHERPINVTILDRIPVSQNDEIKVEYTGRATPTAQNVDDRRGVVAFEAKLDPDEEKILEYGYRISWPASKSIVYGP